MKPRGIRVIQPGSPRACLLGAACAAPLTTSDLCARAGLRHSSSTSLSAIDSLVKSEFLALKFGDDVHERYVLTRAGEEQLDRLHEQEQAEALA